MARIIEGFRWSLKRKSQALSQVVLVSAGMVFLTVFGRLIFFNRMEGTVVDRVNAGRCNA